MVGTRLTKNRLQALTLLQLENVTLCVFFQNTHLGGESAIKVQYCSVLTTLLPECSYLKLYITYNLILARAFSIYQQVNTNFLFVKSCFTHTAVTSHYMKLMLHPVQASMPLQHLGTES